MHDSVAPPNLPRRAPFTPPAPPRPSPLWTAGSSWGGPCMSRSQRYRTGVRRTAVDGHRGTTTEGHHGTAVGHPATGPHGRNRRRHQQHHRLQRRRWQKRRGRRSRRRLTSASARRVVVQRMHWARVLYWFVSGDYLGGKERWRSLVAGAPKQPADDSP